MYVCMYIIAWPRIMKIGQIDVLFAVTRSKMKRRVTYKDSTLYPLKLSS